MNNSRKFPKDFLWGAATASHQIEGGLRNNWTVWEERKSESLLRKSKNKNLTKEHFESNSYLSCDSFNHWRQDIQMLKEMGLNTYRFSLDWSRVEPVDGEFSEEGIAYYIDILKELRANGIEPMVTLWHWTIPEWLEEKGGVLSDVFEEKYTRYIDFVSDRIGEYVKYWITINEPESFAVSHLIGKWPPQKVSISAFNKLFMHTFVDMHKKAYELLKKKNSSYMISIAKNCFYLKDNFFILQPLANLYRQYIIYGYLDKIKDHVDFLGINFYMHIEPKVLWMKRKEGLFSDMGWYMKPSSIFDLLMDIYDRYKLSIIITENGVADTKDQYRKWWIEETVDALGRLLDEGVDIKGYTYWSLLDNFEWDSGFLPKFGLVSVDPKTKARKIKDSGYFFRDLIRGTK